MTAQPDLFGADPDSTSVAAPRLPDLVLARDLVSHEEEAHLIARIDAEQLTPFKFGQWEGKRLTTSFGWSFDFTLGKMVAADPIPAWLAPICQRAANFAGLEPSELSQALLIRYDREAGIGWHRDRPHYDKVIGISLGAPATMRFRQRRAEGGFDRFSAELEPRAAYLLDGEIRQAWEHSIAPMNQPRWSITFRSLSDLSRRYLRPSCQ